MSRKETEKDIVEKLMKMKEERKSLQSLEKSTSSTNKNSRSTGKSDDVETKESIILHTPEQQDSSCKSKSGK